MNIQLAKKDKMSYKEYSTLYWPFGWDKTPVKDVKKVEWDNIEKIHKERQSGKYHTQVLNV